MKFAKKFTSLFFDAPHVCAGMSWYSNLPVSRSDSPVGQGQGQSQGQPGEVRRRRRRPHSAYMERHPPRAESLDDRWVVCVRVCACVCVCSAVVYERVPSGYLCCVDM